MLKNSNQRAPMLCSYILNSSLKQLFVIRTLECYQIQCIFCLYNTFVITKLVFDTKSENLSLFTIVFQMSHETKNLSAAFLISSFQLNTFPLVFYTVGAESTSLFSENCKFL